MPRSSDEHKDKPRAANARRHDATPPEEDYMVAPDNEAPTTGLSDAYAGIDAPYLNIARDDTGTLSADAVDRPGDAQDTDQLASDGREHTTGNLERARGSLHEEQEEQATSPATQRAGSTVTSSDAITIYIRYLTGGLGAPPAEVTSYTTGKLGKPPEADSDVVADTQLGQPERATLPTEVAQPAGITRPAEAPPLIETARPTQVTQSDKLEQPGEIEQPGEVAEAQTQQPAPIEPPAHIQAGGGAAGQTQTSALHNCPRCGAPVVQGQQICTRCGLHFDRLPVILPAAAAAGIGAGAVVEAAPVAARQWTEPLASAPVPAVVPARAPAPAVVRVAPTVSAPAPAPVHAAATEAQSPITAWIEQPVATSRTLPTVLGLLAVLLLVIALILAITGGNTGGTNGTPTPTALVAVVGGTLSPTLTSGAGAVATGTEAETTVAQVTAVIPLTITQAAATAAPTDVPTQQPTNTTEAATAAPPAPTDTLPVPTATALPPTSVPIPPTSVPPTSTAVAAVDTPLPPTSIAIAPTDTVAPPNTPTTAPPPPTDTTIPQPTQPPAPTVQPTPPPATAIAQLGLGSTGSIASWGVTPVQIGTSKTLRSSDPHAMYQASGTYWLVKVSAQNNSGQPSALGADVDFVLKDAEGKLYPELTDHGKTPGVREISVLQGYSYLDAVVPPGGATTVLLIFDVPSDAQPVQVVGRHIVGNYADSNGQVSWNLR